MTRALPILGVILAGALGLAPVVSAAAPDETSDAAIRAKVEQKLQSEDLTNGTGPFVEVKDGMVSLTGVTKNLYAKNRSVAAAMQVAGVTAVQDRLEVPAGESDQKVREAIAREVRRYPFFTIYDDVNVIVDGGNATLVGRVTMPFKADEIAQKVSKVAGVQSIKNELATLPTNIGDERLRAVLGYRIYGNSMFREYASRVNPPIHVIVEHGRVALTGAVRSEVEKRQAEIIARSTFGVFSVDNRLQVAS
jgi:osmotically-inducible protein OsmY